MTVIDACTRHLNAGHGREAAFREEGHVGEQQALILLQVDATKYDRSKAMMAKRIYPVHSHVKYGYR